MTKQNGVESFSFDRFGAKVYHDISRQPTLALREDGFTFLKILGVAYYDGEPTITIWKRRKAMCYRVDNELARFVQKAAMAAGQGIELFPARYIALCERSVWVDASMQKIKSPKLQKFYAN